MSGDAGDSPEPHPEHQPDGEFLAIAERVIVAPLPGRFVPSLVDGTHVAEGDTVGTVVRSGTETAVRSHVTGRFMGHLASEGERVRDGQPLAWVRLAG